MKDIFIISIIIYYLIATFIYVNFLFNPSLEFKMFYKKTGEEIKVSNFILALFCIYWIFFLPNWALNQKRSDDNE